MEKEIWKIVPDFEDYQVSNLGRVKSFKCGKIKILKMVKSNSGYYSVKLYGKTKKMFSVHVLVAIAFLNHKPDRFNLVVNHKNFIRTDNKLLNLEIITNRENLSNKSIKCNSGYVGVYKRSKNKWSSSIYYIGKPIFLGVFDTKEEASEYYRKALKSIELGLKIETLKPVYASNYKGVTWNNYQKKWIGRRKIDGKRRFLGYFENEYDAHLAYENAINKNFTDF